MPSKNIPGSHITRFIQLLLFEFPLPLDPSSKQGSPGSHNDFPGEEERGFLFFFKLLNYIV